MRKLFLVFETDANLSKKSKEPIGVCTSKRASVSLVVTELVTKKKIKSLDIAKFRTLLDEKNQTQGLDINYLIVEITPNQIIK